VGSLVVNNSVLLAGVCKVGVLALNSSNGEVIRTYSNATSCVLGLVLLSLGDVQPEQQQQQQHPHRLQQQEILTLALNRIAVLEEENAQFKLQNLAQQQQLTDIKNAHEHQQQTLVKELAELKELMTSVQKKEEEFQQKVNKLMDDNKSLLASLTDQIAVNDQLKGDIGGLRMQFDEAAHVVGRLKNPTLSAVAKSVSFDETPRSRRASEPIRPLPHMLLHSQSIPESPTTRARANSIDPQRPVANEAAISLLPANAKKWSAYQVKEWAIAAALPYDIVKALNGYTGSELALLGHVEFIIEQLGFTEQQARCLYDAISKLTFD
jgi:hypothetical protein